MTVSASPFRRRGLATCLLLAACGGAPDTAARADADDLDDAASGAAGGRIEFALEGRAPVTVPVTACMGFGQIVTIQGMDGKTVVDLQIVELPALLEGRSMAEASTAGFRTAAQGSSLDADEIWLSQRITSVSLDGRRVRMAGVMTGTAWDEVSPGVGGNPRSTADGAEVPFTLSAQCDG